MPFVMVYNNTHKRSCITQLTCFAWFVGVSVSLSAAECARAYGLATSPSAKSYKYLAICSTLSNLRPFRTPLLSLSPYSSPLLSATITTAAYYLLSHSLFFHLFSQINTFLYFYSFVKKNKIKNTLPHLFLSSFLSCSGHCGDPLSHFY